MLVMIVVELGLAVTGMVIAFEEQIVLMPMMEDVKAIDMDIRVVGVKRLIANVIVTGTVSEIVIGIVIESVIGIGIVRVILQRTGLFSWMSLCKKRGWTNVYVRPLHWSQY